MYIFKKDYRDEILNIECKKGDACHVNGISVEKDGKWIFDIGSLIANEYGYIEDEKHIINISGEELELLKEAVSTYKKQCNCTESTNKITKLNSLFEKLEQQYNN